jgi:hypothetical protein
MRSVRSQMNEEICIFGRPLMTNRPVLLVCAILLSFVPKAKAQDAPDTAKHAAQEEEIRGAVIRYQMEGWARDGDNNERDAKDKRDKAIAKQLNSRIFFVSINGKDPSDEFLKRFQDIPRIVKKRSRAKMNSPHMEWVTDKDTHRPGIIFSADEIRWTKENEVEVDGGYHCGGLCAAGDVFTVRFKGEKWTVIQASLKWIS